MSDDNINFRPIVINNLKDQLGLGETFFDGFPTFDGGVMELKPYVQRDVEHTLALHRLLYGGCTIVMTIDTSVYELILDEEFDAYLELECDLDWGHQGLHHDPETGMEWASPLIVR